MNEVKYPIKYTIMPIAEQLEIKAYIVVKCYLLDTLKIENNNNVYKIVRFYDYEFKKQKPEYFNEDCYNYTLTTTIFDEPQEAIAYARVLNETRVVNANNTDFRKYYQIEQRLLDNKPKQKIIDFNEYKKRRRIK